MQSRSKIAAGLGLLAALVALPVISVRSAIAPGADGPSDAWLTTTAKIAILTSIGARGNTVQVDTMNATMTLFGKVPSAAERASAEELARKVEGVREVRNLLMVAPIGGETATATRDSELRTEVAVALIVAGLRKDSALSGSDVSVRSVDEGTVSLSGTANLVAHLRAIEIAKGVSGVRAVRSAVRSPDVEAVNRARFLGQ